MPQAEPFREAPAALRPPPAAQGGLPAAFHVSPPRASPARAGRARCAAGRFSAASLCRGITNAEFGERRSQIGRRPPPRPARCARADRQRPPPRRAAAPCRGNGRPARASRPRLTSSCSLVSSRATAACRSPRTSRHVGEAIGETLRAFEKHQGSLDRSPSLQRSPPGRLPGRQEAGVTGSCPAAGRKGPVRPVTADRAGNGGDRQIFGDRRPHELVAGVGDERRSGIRHQRHSRVPRAARREWRAGPVRHCGRDRFRAVSRSRISPAAFW